MQQQILIATATGTSCCSTGGAGQAGLDVCRLQHRNRRPLVRVLRAAGWDVQHLGDVGMSSASDREILQYARGERRVCVTLDADFHTQLAVSGAAGPSTVRIRIEGLNGRALAELLQRVWPMVRDDLDRGSMATITERDVRMHRLPIGRGGQ